MCRSQCRPGQLLGVTAQPQLSSRALHLDFSTSVSLQRCSTCRAMKTLRAYTGSSFLSFFKGIFLRFFLIYPFVLIVADCTSITSYSPDVSSGFVGIAHCSVVLCTDFPPVQCSGNVHVTCCNFSWSTKFMSRSILTLHQL